VTDLYTDVRQKRILVGNSLLGNRVYTAENFEARDDGTIIGTLIADTTNFITGILLSNAGIAGNFTIQIPAIGNPVVDGSSGIIAGYLAAGDTVMISNGGILGIYKAPIYIYHTWGAGKAYGTIFRFRENVQA